jgi:hypothetical protein
MTAPLSELIRRRRQLKERITKMMVELDALDRMIFPRMAKMAEAWDGVPERQATSPQSAGDFSSFRQTNAAFHAVEPLSANRLSFGTNGDVLSLNGVDPGSMVSVPISATTFSPSITVFDAPPKSITDAVKGLLEKNGVPMKAGHIFRSLLEMGIAVPGQKPLNNLSAHLSNDKRFVSTPQGWAIRSPSLISERPKNPAES